MEINISNNRFYKKAILFSLKGLIVFISLFVNKYVYRFRTNQENILKIFIIIILAFYLKQFLKVKKIIWYKNRLNLPIFIFVLVISISLLRSETVILSVKDYIIYLSYLIIYFVIINSIYKKEQFNSFIKLFFVTSFVISVYTLIQYYGIDPYLRYLHSLTSTIGQKNWISNYLAMIFPVIFSYFLWEQTKKNKIIYFFLLSILYLTLMICQSRGIWISISITVILAIYIIFKLKFYGIFRRNKKWLFLLLITFLVITVIYSTDNPLNKSALTVPQRALSTFDEKDPSINTRLLMWKTTLEMVKDRPIFGSGIGTFKMNYLNYQAEFLKDNPYYLKYSGKAGEAHNEYLQMWAELGIIGLGIFLLIIFIFYKLVGKFLKEEKDNEKRLVCLGLFLGINCFLIHSLFTFPLHVPALGVIFFALMGLTVVYTRKIDLPKANPDSSRPEEFKLKNKLVKIALSILIFVFMIFVVNLLVIKPYIAEIYYFKGMRYYVDNNYREALPDFDYAAQLDPYNGRILHALGTTYYHLNDQSKAEDILQETKKYITDRNTFRNLGLSHMQSGRYQEAEKELNHAIYLDPKFTKAYIDLAYLYAKQKDYDNAIIEWNKILEIDSDFSEKYNVLYFMGMAYQKKEMPDKALEYFLEALQLAPEGNPIIEEIEEELYNIYKGNLDN